MKRSFFLLFLFLSLSLGFPVHSSVEPLVTVQKIDQVVYVTKTGKKYHRSSCRYLSKSKITSSKKKAVATGYTACKVCKP